MLIALQPLRTRVLRPQTFDAFFRRKYDHRLRKALYFLWREGILQTIRKSRSKLLEKRIEDEQQLLIALVEADGTRAIGITRALGDSTVFPEELLWEIPADRDLDDVRIPADAARLLESYLPVPSSPVPTDARRLIQEANPFLLPLRMRPAPAPAPRAAAQVESGEVFIVGYGGYIREYVSRYFGREAAAAVDYKANLIRRLASPDVTIVNELSSVLPAIASAKRPLVIIAAYHSDHAPIALKVLDENPRANVFVEKPLAVTLEDAAALSRRRAEGAWIDVGFNRRFAPLTKVAVQALRDRRQPLVMTAVVKEVKIPATHWYLWPNQGTRITGNACHWIDLAYDLVRAAPREIGVVRSDEDATITILFSDGSLFTLVATDRGSDLAGVEEMIDIRCGDTSVTINDYRECVVKKGAVIRTTRRIRRDRGHDRMYRDLRRRWCDGLPPAYPADAMLPVAYMTYHASRLFTSGIRTFLCADDPDVVAGTSALVERSA